MIYISDLYEGPLGPPLVKQFAALVERKVHCLCLLALDDTGRASYDHEIAQKMVNMGILTLACTPNKLIELVGQVLRGQEVRA